MLYRWSPCIQYSGELVQLDNTPVVACVKGSTSVAAEGELSDATKDNLEALNATIAEKIANRRGVAPAGSGEISTEYLSVTDKLVYIPNFGYLLVNTDPFGIETKEGVKMDVFVATRARGLKGKASSFYLFDSGHGYASGKIGNMKLDIWETQVYDDRKSYHFVLTAYNSFRRY